MKKCSLLLLFIVALALVARSVSAQTPPSAAQFYLAALDATKRLEVPAFATYEAKIHAVGAQLTVEQVGADKQLLFLEQIGPHENPDTSYSVAYRSDTDSSNVTEGKKFLGQTRRTMFNPTWQGVYDWLMFGPAGEPESAVKARAAQAKLAPVAPAPKLKTIAILKAMGSAIYHVRDAGAAVCPNGDPGHQVQTIARRDPEHHPLLNATIDLHNGVSCSLRFHIAGSGPMVGITGYAEEHFGTVGSYWMATDVHIVDDIRVAGIAVHHVSIDVAYTGMQFPTSLPAQEMVVPKNGVRR